MHAAVDCLASDSPVLPFEPNAGPDDRAEAWFTGSPSLAQWPNSWLDGTGWWEEEVMMAEAAAEPHPSVLCRETARGTGLRGACATGSNSRA